MKQLVIFLLVACMAAGAWAQTPVIDGILGADEYTQTETKTGITVAANLSTDGTILYLAVQAKTTGWVAIGAGSQKMDTAFMALAYVVGITQTISEETGKGKGHSVNTGKLLTSAYVAEAGELTTLEIALPAAGFVKNKVVELIAAYGPRDNRTSIHRSRASFKLTF